MDDSYLHLEPPAELHADYEDSYEDYDENDEHCAAQLQRYTNVSVKGAGSYGIALLATFDGETDSIIVKLLPRTESTVWESMDEIGKTLRVRTLAASVPAVARFFPRIYGWIACGPPEEPSWLEAIERFYARPDYYVNSRDVVEQFDYEDDPVYYLVSQYGGDSLDGDHYFTSLELCQEFLFELFYALSLVRSVMSHGDLHAGNVLAHKATETPRRIEYGEHIVTVYSSKAPMLIDYGKTKFTPVAYELRDVPLFLQSMIDRERYRDTPIRTHLEALNTFVDTGRLKTFDELLTHCMQPLEHRHVRSPVKPKLNPQSSTPAPAKRRALFQNENACIQCGADATRALAHAPSYRFCERDRCVQRLGPVAHIIAREL